MMTIKRVLADGTCVFCNKQKEVAAVLLDGKPAEVLLCWADVRKHAQMQMRMSGQVPPKADPRPAPVNGPATAAPGAKP